MHNALNNLNKMLFNRQHRRSVSLNNALNTNETYMTDDLAQQDESSNNQFVNFNRNQNEEHTLNLSQRVYLNKDHDRSNGAEYAIQTCSTIITMKQ